MKLVTWNVNSLNVRLARLLDWLAANAPDVVCLQETKLEDAKFPVAALDAAGYASHFTGQKTYNGVAILARHGLAVAEVAAGVEGFVDEQKRLIAATVDGVRVICAYVPNGQSVDSDKYRYKLSWCDAVAKHLHAALTHHPALAIAGDFNVAPDDRDVHDPALWAGQVLCSEPERAAFREFLNAGL
ncbi:MAG: exodeoxyribonuclease III, partial [Casimicrobiaceae bacterium]